MCFKGEAWEDNELEYAVDLALIFDEDAFAAEEFFEKTTLGTAFGMSAPPMPRRFRNNSTFFLNFSFFWQDSVRTLLTLSNFAVTSNSLSRRS